MTGIWEFFADPSGEHVLGHDGFLDPGLLCFVFAGVLFWGWWRGGGDGCTEARYDRGGQGTGWGVGENGSRRCELF